MTAIAINIWCEITRWLYVYSKLLLDLTCFFFVLFLFFYWEYDKWITVSVKIIEWHALQTFFTLLKIQFQINIKQTCVFMCVSNHTLEKKVLRPQFLYVRNFWYLSISLLLSISSKWIWWLVRRPHLICMMMVIMMIYIIIKKHVLAHITTYKNLWAINT